MELAVNRWLVAGTAVALLVLGGLYHGAKTDLVKTRAELSAAVQANEENKKAIERLEHSIENTNAVLAEWNKDRTTLAEVRSATRQAIKEAMRDETFKAWASSLAPGGAWRLLRETPGANGNGTSDASGGTASGLPGNGNPGERK